MASYHDIVQRVLGLKSKLSNDPLPETPKIIRLLQKLSVLPVNVEILQETRIGKCVNGLKKKCPEVAVYVKPLINSWKTVVRTAMLEEENPTDPVRENGDVSETNEDGSVSSPPGTPGTSSPNTEQEESHNRRTGQSFTYSPPPEQKNKSSGSSHERHSQSQKDVPPTPIPWSPERKIFSPFVSKKGQQKEKEKIQTKMTQGDDLTNRKRKEKDNDSGHLLKSESSDLKGTSSRSVHARSRETFDGCASKPREDSNIVNRSKNSEKSVEKSKVFSKEAIYNKLQSLHSIEKKKPMASNVLLNDKLSSRSHSGVKRSTRDGTDKPMAKSHSEISLTKDSKKPSAKSKPLEDSSLLFQVDMPKSERKSSSQRVAVSPGFGEDHKKQSSSSNVRDGKRREKEDIHLSEQVGKKRIEHKKKLPSSKLELDRKAGKVSNETTSPKVSIPRKDKLKSQANRDATSTKLSSKIESSDPSDNDEPTVKKSETEERTYENTGMSFEDCLLGGAPVVKKIKVSTSSVKHRTERQRPAKHAGKTSSTQRSEKGRRERSEEKMGRKVTDEGRDGRPKKRKPTDESSSSRNSGKRAKETKKIESDDVKEASASEVDMSLPDIHPDYKPARPLPEVKLPERRKTYDANLAPQWYGSKQTKTKVYSGKARKRNWETLPSLQDICKEVIFDNIDALYETGGVPYYIMEDILEKCTANQLLKIEDYNPDYILESDNLWKRHTERTFKGAQQDEMESWRELYLRKNDEREYKFLAITANITASMAKKETGRLTKLAFVDRPVKPPRNVIRQQLRHGTSSSSVPAKAPRPRKEVPGEEPSHRIIPDREPSSPVKRQRTAKVVAPMMQKSLKMMKRVNSRR